MTDQNQTLIDGINTKLNEYRQKSEQAEAEAKRFGQETAETKGQMEAMKQDLVLLQGQLADFKRAQVLQGGAGQQSQEDAEVKSVFDRILRKSDPRFTDAEQKALSTITNPDGGYLVPRDTSGRIITKIQDFSPMRRYASIQAISTDALEGLLDNGVNSSGWVGETQARPATNTAQLGKWRIPVHEMYANPMATQKLLEDSAVDAEAWLIRKTSEQFARMEAEAFITGDGSTKPRGILAPSLSTSASPAWGTVQKIKTGTNGGFGATTNGGDKLIDLITALRPAYAGGAIFAMNRFTLGELMKLKDGDGNYLWKPDFSQGAGGLLLGYRVDASFDHMPNIGTGSKSIIFGNLAEAYQIVDRRGIVILRDPYTNKPYVSFYTTMRVGGDVINTEAYKVMTFEA